MSSKMHHYFKYEILVIFPAIMLQFVSPYLLPFPIPCVYAKTSKWKNHINIIKYYQHCLYTPHLISSNMNLNVAKSKL